MKIKKLNISDIDSILELESHSAPEKPMYAKYDREALEYIFKNPTICEAFGMFEGKNLIGWSSYRSAWNKDNKEKGVYEMSSLVVHKDYRRKGVGLKLFNKRLKTILEKSDLKRIYATASPQNKPIIMLYLNNNFIIYDFKHDVYGPGVDRIYMKYEKN